MASSQEQTHAGPSGQSQGPTAGRTPDRRKAATDFSPPGTPVRDSFDFVNQDSDLARLKAKMRADKARMDAAMAPVRPKAPPAADLPPATVPSFGTPPKLRARSDSANERTRAIEAAARLAREEQSKKAKAAEAAKQAKAEADAQAAAQALADKKAEDEAKAERAKNIAAKEARIAELAAWKAQEDAKLEQAKRLADDIAARRAKVLAEQERVKKAIADAPKLIPDEEPEPEGPTPIEIRDELKAALGPDYKRDIGKAVAIIEEAASVEERNLEYNRSLPTTEGARVEELPSPSPSPSFHDLPADTEDAQPPMSDGGTADTEEGKAIPSGMYAIRFNYGWRRETNERQLLVYKPAKMRWNEKKQGMDLLDPACFYKATDFSVLSVNAWREKNWMTSDYAVKVLQVCRGQAVCKPIFLAYARDDALFSHLCNPEGIPKDLSQLVQLKAMAEMDFMRAQMQARPDSLPRPIDDALKGLTLASRHLPELALTGLMASMHSLKHASRSMPIEKIWSKILIMVDGCLLRVNWKEGPNVYARRVIRRVGNVHRKRANEVVQLYVKEGWKGSHQPATVSVSDAASWSQKASAALATATNALGSAKEASRAATGRVVPTFVFHKLLDEVVVAVEGKDTGFAGSVKSKAAKLWALAPGIHPVEWARSVLATAGGILGRAKHLKIPTLGGIKESWKGFCDSLSGWAAKTRATLRANPVPSLSGIVHGSKAAFAHCVSKTPVFLKRGFSSVSSGVNWVTSKIWHRRVTRVARVAVAYSTALIGQSAGQYTPKPVRAYMNHLGHRFGRVAATDSRPAAAFTYLWQVIRTFFDYRYTADIEFACGRGASIQCGHHCAHYEKGFPSLPRRLIEYFTKGEMSAWDIRPFVNGTQKRPEGYLEWVNLAPNLSYPVTLVTAVFGPRLACDDRWGDVGSCNEGWAVATSDEVDSFFGARQEVVSEERRALERQAAASTSKGKGLPSLESILK